ncbi:MAG: PEGA domain-containing protein [Planctomycetota bacterium]|jgi:WD40 repeat protein
MAKSTSLAPLVLAALVAHASAAGQPVGRVQTSPVRTTRLFIEVRPPGALVELDGRLLNASEGLFTVSPGRHMLRVEAPGHRPKERRVETPAGRITRLPIELEKLPASGAAEPIRPRSAAPARPLSARPRLGLALSDLPWGDVAPAAEPRALVTLRGHESPVNWIEFSPDGRTLASAGADNTVRLWGVPGGKLHRVLDAHKDLLGVGCVAFSPDGNTLASCSGTTVQLWDLKTGMPLTEAANLGPARHVAFSSDGTTLAVATGADQVTLCDVESLHVRSVLKSRPGAEELLLGQDSSLRRITYAPDGRLLACGGGSHPQSPGRVTVWSTRTMSLVTSFETSDGRVQGIAFSPSNRLLAYAAGTTVRLVEIAKLPKPPAGSR